LILSCNLPERKVGGGYIFVHRLLQDYFAELWEREYGEADHTD
jgi:hypothetical protein